MRRPDVSVKREMLDSFQRYWHGDQDEVQLLLDLRDPDERRRHRVAGLTAVAAQVLVIVAIVLMPAGPPPRDLGVRITLDAKRSTPVFIPRDMAEFRLTQKAPQTKAPVTEVNLEQLLPRAARTPSPPNIPAPEKAKPRPAAVESPHPAPKQPEVARIEPPRIEIPQQGQTPEPTGPAPQAPPPAEQKPKLAFESVGSWQGTRTGTAVGQSAIRPPGSSVSDATKAVIRGGVPQGSSGTGEMMQQSPLQGREAAMPELLSDPQGVDFKPYLIQVLATVRRNWRAVLPESVRFGQQGRVVVQFIVNRQGGVPKLVLARESGMGALDRAAVAGIQASLPLPPLPSEFKGSEVRLQMVFSYNMPQR